MREVTHDEGVDLLEGPLRLKAARGRERKIH
jgi:hypothetical protein